MAPQSLAWHRMAHQASQGLVHPSLAPEGLAWPLRHRVPLCLSRWLLRPREQKGVLSGDLSPREQAKVSL